MIRSFPVIYLLCMAVPKPEPEEPVVKHLRDVLYFKKPTNECFFFCLVSGKNLYTNEYVAIKLVSAHFLSVLDS